MSRYIANAPTAHANEAEHRRLIAVRANAGLPKDGSHPMVSPLILASYTVATVPTASLWTSGVIVVTDETGGFTLAFSDGSNWRRMQDRAVVS